MYFHNIVEINKIAYECKIAWWVTIFLTEDMKTNITRFVKARHDDNGGHHRNQLPVTSMISALQRIYSHRKPFAISLRCLLKKY